MVEVESSKIVEIPGPAAEVWRLLADFGAIEKWWPAGMLEKVVSEGEGIGMVRHMHTLIGLILSERLDGLDHETRTIRLSIIDGLPLGIEDYHAVGRVIANEENVCTLDWRGTYEIPSASSEADARAVIEGAYEAQAMGLLSHFAKRAS